MCLGTNVASGWFMAATCLSNGPTSRGDTSPSESQNRADTISDSDLVSHVAALRAAARRLTPHRAEREDLIQDTLERALRYRAAKLPCPHNLRAWLLCILRNLFVDQKRRATIVYEPGLATIDACTDAEAPVDPPWAALSMADIEDALARIEPNQRVAFELHYVRGLRYREVAVNLNISGNTVASRLHRARLAMQKVLHRDPA